MRSFLHNGTRRTHTKPLLSILQLSSQLPYYPLPPTEQEGEVVCWCFNNQIITKPNISVRAPFTSIQNVYDPSIYPVRKMNPLSAQWGESGGVSLLRRWAGECSDGDTVVLKKPSTWETATLWLSVSVCRALAAATNYQQTFTVCQRSEKTFLKKEKENGPLKLYCMNSHFKISPLVFVPLILLISQVCQCYNPVIILCAGHKDSKKHVWPVFWNLEVKYRRLLMQCLIDKHEWIQSCAWWLWPGDLTHLSTCVWSSVSRRKLSPTYSHHVVLTMLSKMVYKPVNEY